MYRSRYWRCGASRGGPACVQSHSHKTKVVRTIVLSLKGTSCFGCVSVQRFNFACLQRGVRCPHEHALRHWDRQPYPGRGTVRCSLCKRVVEPTAGFLRCHACNFDICLLCQSTQAAARVSNRAQQRVQLEMQLRQLEQDDTDSDASADSDCGEGARLLAAPTPSVPPAHDGAGSEVYVPVAPVRDDGGASQRRGPRGTAK